jgi:hypothetical protein
MAKSQVQCVKRDKNEKMSTKVCKAGQRPAKYIIWGENFSFLIGELKEPSGNGINLAINRLKHKNNKKMNYL